ncbi:DUF4340 domain-containing protein, partial [Akkermansiaceae bacterium]|nr:DUF4340 domain-containing protein [Akkermansiaceae bacterium]
MSRLHLIILWVLALVVGIIVFSVQGNRRDALASETTLKPGDIVISTDDLRSYGGLKFADAKNTTTLVNKEDAWLIAEQGDYPVNLNTLATAFDSVRELKILQGLPAESKHWDRFGLNTEAEKEANRPRQLSLLAKDGSVAKTIFIGKARESSGGQQGASAGRFVRLSDDDSGVYIVQQPFTQLNADPLTWIDKTLPKVEGILSITMKPDNELLAPWTVTRPTAIGEFTLEGLEEGLETDPTATAPLKSLFASSNFTELLSPEEVAKRAVVEDSREITIKTASGISYLFTIIPEKKDAPLEEKKDDKAEKTDDRNYIVSYKLLTGPSDPAKPAEDASDADKAGYHALVANKKMSERLYQEHKALQGRQFLVSNFVVNGLLKHRHKMNKAKAKPAAVSNPVM